MLLYKYFAVKCKLCHPIGPLSLSLSSSAIVAANREITKVMDIEKEETMKNCSLAWPEQSSCRALSLSVYAESNNALHEREIWLVLCSHATPFPVERWKMGWLHKTRRIAAKEVNTQSIYKVFPAVKIELAKYAAQHGIW